MQGPSPLMAQSSEATSMPQVLLGFYCHGVSRVCKAECVSGSSKRLARDSDPCGQDLDRVKASRMNVTYLSLLCKGLCRNRGSALLCRRTSTEQAARKPSCPWNLEGKAPLFIFLFIVTNLESGAEDARPFTSHEHGTFSSFIWWGEYQHLLQGTVVKIKCT